jgi:hypothetical protein
MIRRCGEMRARIGCDGETGERTLEVGEGVEGSVELGVVEVREERRERNAMDDPDERDRVTARGGRGGDGRNCWRLMRR